MWHPILSRGRSIPSPRRSFRPCRAIRPGLDGRSKTASSSPPSSTRCSRSGTTRRSIVPYDNAVDAAGNTLRDRLPLRHDGPRPDRGPSRRLRHPDPERVAPTYVAKYAPDNTLVWARPMGSGYRRSANPNYPTEKGRGIAVDGAGNVYVTGDFVGQVTLGSTTLTGTGSTDAFVTKLDPNGNYLWARRWGGSATRSSPTRSPSMPTAT